LFLSIPDLLVQVLHTNTAVKMAIGLDTDNLNGLCSKDQLELLDAVDRLRLEGINSYISLPQIIVCGDQSSGKSSVLEALSGVPFPVKSNLCTRFPTELVLRRTSQNDITVSIVPHASASQIERTRLAGFRKKLDTFLGLPDLVEQARAAMGISLESQGFSNHLLRIEISGPDRPPLTIVDLPGLIHSETKQQTAADVELVQGVVKGYMEQPRSIILAVVSAKNDFANQVVLKLAREADLLGHRTLGVITKPDTLNPGSGSEKMFVSLARNNEVEFRLGWHVLKNLDSETEKGMSLLHKRRTEEAQFFTKGVWKQLPSSMLGIQELKNRLSNILLKQIATELPSLTREIDISLKSCQDELRRLGDPRSTLDEQRLQLLQISQDFQSLLKASIDGTYTGSFFVDAESEKGYKQRIRAIVQNLNRDFAKDLATSGHYRAITASESEGNADTGKGKGTGQPPEKPIPITRTAFVKHAELLMERTRGRELPGHFNSMIVTDLFLEQSAPWEPIVRRHVLRVWEAASDFLRLVVEYIADGGISRELDAQVLSPALAELLSDINTKTSELLSPHKRMHPITYNDQYAEEMKQKKPPAPTRDEITTVVRNHFSNYQLSTSVHISAYVNFVQLINDLVNCAQPKPPVSAASEALDSMEVYYKVAMKRFIDNVAVEIIEEKLLSKLLDILSAVTVYRMSEDTIASIAGESIESRTLRRKLERQIGVLEKGSETCKRFASARLGDSASTNGKASGSNEDPFE
jgi:GTPase SAR1 family protein